MIGNTLRALMLLCAHVPYRFFLRTIGPRPAIVVSRMAAFGHWLLTFIGVGWSLRRVVKAVLPHLEPELSVSTFMRRFLMELHQDFAVRAVSVTPRGKRFIERSYYFEEGREHLDKAVSEGRGLILLIFHFGQPQLLFSALKNFGYDAEPLLFRGGQRYARHTFKWVARFVRDVSAQADSRMGPALHSQPNLAFPMVVRRLRRGAIIGNAGDGSLGTTFLEVPFLDGTIRVSTGTALMAAHSGSPIVPIFCLQEGINRHRIIAHAPLYCREHTAEAVAETTEAYVKVLEEYLHLCPWQWETLQRLTVDYYPDGRLRLGVKVQTGSAEMFLANPNGGPAQLHQASA
jgi:lauroyl/myristoyl acyltransferase